LEDLNRAYTPGHAGTDTSKTPIKPDWYWALERIQTEDAVYDDDPNTLLYDGTGVHVFVIDTGCNLNHAEFAGRVGTSYRAYPEGGEGPVECEASDTSKCTDFNGHGTHCASTILGARAGVAPGATLHCVGTRLGRSGSGMDLWRGTNWIVNYYNTYLKPYGTPAIVSASLGGGASGWLDRLFNATSAAGMLTLVAAGNDDQDACGKSPARLGGANNTNVITIGASAVDDSKGLFSNWGPCVNMWAPGVGILAARHDSDTLMTVMSGTSMATPVAAGVAALALEVAAYSSMQQYTHMSAQTASEVKNWLLHTAQQDKITAIAASSIVPVSFVSTMRQEQSTSYAVKQWALPCTSGACQLSNEELNVQNTANLLVHVPEYMQDIPTQVNVSLMACSSYLLPTYNEECPPAGTEICGNSTAVAPDGTIVGRPFRKKTQTCEDGCDCDPPEIISYESCAQTGIDYRFTEQECSPVYTIASERLTRRMSGYEFTWTPTTGGDAYDLEEPSMKGMDTIASGDTWTRAFRILDDGTYRYGWAPTSYPFTDDGVYYVGTTWGAPFYFYGVPYTKLLLSNDGYMCFDYATALWNRKSQPTYEAHYTAAAGPCFSFLLTDFAPGSFTYYTQVKYIMGSGWQAESMTFTYSSRLLAGHQYLDDPSLATVSVQVKLLFEGNQIVVNYASLPDSLSAVIGPSPGTGLPAGFDARYRLNITLPTDN
jgi:hypothetical protein